MAENGTPEPTAPNTIVLVHGFWATPRSWEGVDRTLRGQGLPRDRPRLPRL